MAAMAGKMRVTFAEVPVNGATLYVARTSADRARSRQLLEENGLRMVTGQEGLLYLTTTPKFKNQMKGIWFHIESTMEYLTKSGLYEIGAKGKLINLKTRDPEKIVYLGGGFNGSLGVDVDGRAFNCRYGIGSKQSHELAPLVIGIKRTGQSAETTDRPKPLREMADDLIRSKRSAM
jgi:hypothetical protein